MSLRTTSPSSASPRPRTDDARFILSFGRGDRTRTLAIKPGIFYAAATLVPAVAAVYIGAAAYLFFRDDLVAGLMARQAHQQYAYEDRLATLRLQIDRMASRQMLDQDSFDGKLRDLASRQARLETRAALVGTLSDVVGSVGTDRAAPQPTRSRPVEAATLPWIGRPRPAPAPVEPTAPIDNPEQPLRPHPDDGGLRPSADADETVRTRPTLAEIGSDDLPPGTRLGTLVTSLERVERSQIAALQRIERPAAQAATRLRAAINAAGLSLERLKAPATTADGPVGGPFVPLRIDPTASEFDAQVARTQAAVLSLDAARRLVPALPLRKPLAGTLEQTSAFGYRLDPFLGRPALHSGIDFRGDYGSPVRATGGGKVVAAGPTGGYGNMVEIDHGNGISTRYGHLSAIMVSEGQTVSVGAVVGRVGSTGRSTGNHLHYEVRLDDEAVDPSRFIRAASMLEAN